MSKITFRGWAKVQIYGMLTITVMIVVVIGALEIYEHIAPSTIPDTNIINLKNGGLTGVFVVWLILALLFSFINAIVHITRSSGHSKRA
jgi:hypothetical protein